MRVLLLGIALLGLCLASDSSYWAFDDKRYKLENELESVCKEQDGDVEVELGKGEDSVVFFSIGRSSESVKDCRIEIESPDDYGIVMAVEYYYDLRPNKTDETEKCTKTMEVSFHEKGTKQESVFCMTNLQTLDSSNVTVTHHLQYVLYSTSGDEMHAKYCSDGEDDGIQYGLVFTAVKLESDCGEDYIQCKSPGADGTPHCYYRDLKCDGHVNCATVPESNDDLLETCHHNTTFRGTVGHGDYDYSFWIFYQIFTVMLILLLTVLIVCLVRICYLKAKRSRRARASRNSGITTIDVPVSNTITAALPEKSEVSPPDYSTVAELPPAYHSLFYSLDKPSSQQTTNQAGTEA